MGWRARDLGWLMMGLCITGMSARAQSPESPPGQSAPRAGGTEQADVSLEFLEFLGTWESSDGEWVGPGQVQSEDWPSDPSGDADRERGDD